MNISSTVDVAKLRGLYEASDAARAILDHFASRERNWGQTTVERLQHNVGSEGFSLSRGQVVDVLKKLEECGCGRFIPGRWSHPSRFEWQVGMVSVGQIACR